MANVLDRAHEITAPNGEGENVASNEVTHCSACGAVCDVEEGCYCPDSCPLQP